MSSAAASAATAPKLSCRSVGVWVMILFAATHSATGTPQRRAAALVSIRRAAAPAVRKYSWLSRIDRLPPVSMVRKIRLRRRCSLVDAYSAWTLLQSQPNSSATSMGRPVKLPWPISTRATRMMMVSSGRISIQAVTSGVFSASARVCSASAKPDFGSVTSNISPPPTAAERNKNERRDMFDICFIGVSLSLRPVLRAGFLSGSMNGGPNTRIRPTPANIRHGFVDVGIGWVWLFFQQRGGRHNHAGLAIPALRHLMRNPGLL